MMKKTDLVRCEQKEIEKNKYKLQKLLRKKVNSEKERSLLRDAISSNENCLVELLRKEVHLTQELARMNDQEYLKKNNSKQATEVNRLRESMGAHQVFGFLFELAIVNPPYCTALNSVLSGVLRHVVVENRDIAIRLSEEFSRKSLGKVTCAIINELDYKNQTTNACPCHPQESGDYVPLCSVFKCIDECAFRPLFHKYCQAWIVCTDEDSAVAIMSKQKRQGNKKHLKNCVTLKGDLFFNDGVIQATQSNKFDPKRSQCVIAPGDCEVHQTTVNIPGSSSASEIIELNSSMKSLLQEKNEKEKQCLQLKEQLGKIESTIAMSTRKSKELEVLLRDLQSKLESDRKLEIMAKTKFEAFDHGVLNAVNTTLSLLVVKCDKMKDKLSDFSLQLEKKDGLESQLHELIRDRNAMTQKRRELLALIDVKHSEKVMP
jgi:chromosome segregation ATPase